MAPRRRPGEAYADLSLKTAICIPAGEPGQGSPLARRMSRINHRPVRLMGGIPYDWAGTALTGRSEGRLDVPNQGGLRPDAVRNGYRREHPHGVRIDPS